MDHHRLVIEEAGPRRDGVRSVDRQASARLDGVPLDETSIGQLRFHGCLQRSAAVTCDNRRRRADGMWPGRGMRWN